MPAYKQNPQHLAPPCNEIHLAYTADVTGFLLPSGDAGTRAYDALGERKTDEAARALVFSCVHARQFLRSNHLAPDASLI